MNIRNISKVCLGSRVAIGLQGTDEEIEQNFNFFWNHGAISVESPTQTFGLTALKYFITTKAKLLKALANAALVRTAEDPNNVGTAMKIWSENKARQEFEEIPDGNFKNFIAPPSKRAQKTGDCLADVEVGKAKLDSPEEGQEPQIN